ncbi:MAG: type II toxin-antitoxin system Phd/YefM family antitoxin [Sporichthyaceae bacterium]
MSVSPSELRANIYRLLDEVLESGIPLEVERNGRTLRIVPDEPRAKLARLVPHPDAIVGDPEDLVAMDWSGAWSPDGT